MNRTSKELKRLSRQSLLGNYGLVILALFLTQLITNVVISPFQAQMQNYSRSASLAELNMTLPADSQLAASPGSFPIWALVAMIIIALLATVLMAGEQKIHLALARGNKLPISTLFSEFKNRPDRYIVYTLLNVVITLACILPLIIIMAIISVNVVPNDATIAIVSVVFTLAVCVIVIFIQLRMSLSIYFLLDNPSLGAMSAIKESFRTMKGHCWRRLYIDLSFIPMGILVVLSLGIAGLWVQPYMYQVNAYFYIDTIGEIDRKIEEERRMEEEMGPMLTDEKF